MHSILPLYTSCSSCQVMMTVMIAPSEDIRLDRHRLYSWAYHKTECLARRLGLLQEQVKIASRAKAGAVCREAGFTWLRLQAIYSQTPYPANAPKRSEMFNPPETLACLAVLRSCQVGGILLLHQAKLMYAELTPTSKSASLLELVLCV